MKEPALAAQLGALDCAAPWFAPHKDAIRACRHHMARGADVAAALNALHPTGEAVPRFVPVAAALPGEAYEAFVARTGFVPTRDNLHDFFNGLCWQRFPKAKRRLNQLQAEHISKDGVQPVRGPVRDALTLLDENGALLFAPDPLWQALRARDWKRLFTDLRPLWSQARLELVGHALLEKLASPRKSATAHVYIGQTAIKSIAPLAPQTVDEWLADDLQAVHLTGKPFAPMPVLGVPDWWPANGAPGFYDDAAVFRPPAKEAITAKFL